MKYDEMHTWKEQTKKTKNKIIIIDSDAHSLNCAMDRVKPALSVFVLFPLLLVPSCLA